jgi:4-amino-4-deoxy-L-arabinose transferase-like glycosyltransferase
MIVLVALAVAVRLTYIDRNPHYDEMYHVLAAQSLIEDGSYTINQEGIYTRAPHFTHAVAIGMRLGGDNLVAARIPALLASVIWVACVFWWLRGRCGPIAAWTAGLMMCFEPTMIFLGQFARFYSVHGLAIWLAFIAVWTIINPEATNRRRIVAVVGGALAVALAFSFQLTTFLGCVGIGAAAAVLLSPIPWRAVTRRGMAFTTGVAIAIVVLTVITAVILVMSGSVSKAAFMLSWSPEWNAEYRGDIRFYFDMFVDRFGFVWMLLPAAVLVALYGHFRRALFTTTVLSVTFLLHSLAGAKDLRYVAYSLPFIFVIWGLALAVALPALHRTTRHVLAQVLTGRAFDPWLGALSTIVVTACVLFAIYPIKSFNITQNMIVRQLAHGPFQSSGWHTSRDDLRALAEDADVIITSAGPKASYYFDDYDLEINYANYGDSVAQWRYGDPDREANPVQVIDWRLGRPNARDQEAVGLLIDEHDHGLIVIERVHWRTNWGVTPEIADCIEANTQRVDFPEESRLLVFRW